MAGGLPESFLEVGVQLLSNVEQKAEGRVIFFFASTQPYHNAGIISFFEHA